MAVDRKTPECKRHGWNQKPILSIRGFDLAVARQAARIRQLEAKLSQMLGDQAWRESGLGAPEDIDKLKRRITELERHVVELARQLEERGEELAAARAANREMITQFNAVPRRNGLPGGET